MANGLEYIYHEPYAGAKLIARDDAQLTTYPVATGDVYVHFMENGEWVELTGCGYYNPDYPNVLYLQTTNGMYFAVLNNKSVDANGKLKDWSMATSKMSLPKYSRDDAQRMVDGIIKNNIHIVENNLLCARYADKFTAEERKQIVQLQQRVQERMNAITDTGYCENIEKSYPKGYADLEPYLANLMKSEGVGLVWWAWCIVAAFVLGSFATVAYYVYHDLFEQSQDDVKWSDELTRKLQEKLTPEEYEQLRSETQGIVTKAKIQAKVGTWKSAIKVGAILVACALVINLVRK